MINQLNKHDPENGVFGDCLRTCVANYLGVHPSEIPAPQTSEDYPTKLINDYLIPRGMILLWDGYESTPSIKWFHDVEKDKGSNIPYIISGGVNEKSSVHHACLYVNGRLLHNPSGVDIGIDYAVKEEDGDDKGSFFVYRIVHLPTDDILIQNEELQ